MVYASPINVQYVMCRHYMGPILESIDYYYQNIRILLDIRDVEFFFF